jgi:hypothetical protein
MGIFRKGLKGNDIGLLCKEFGAGNYVEDKDYIVYLTSKH